MSARSSQAARRAGKRADQWVSVRPGSGIATRGKNGTQFGVWPKGGTRYVPVDAKTFTEAQKIKTELDARHNRGERVVTKRVRFPEASSAWWETKADRLGPWTAQNYRWALDNVHGPYFGKSLVSTIDVDELGKLTRGLEQRGLNVVDRSRPVRPLAAKTISAYMCPLQGVLAFAARRRWIALDPFTLLTSDDRPRLSENDSRPYEWSDEDVERLLVASAELAARPEARADYTLILRAALETGMRQSELIGLPWRCVDLEAGVIHVEQQWSRARTMIPPKTKAGLRRIPILPELVTALRVHKERAFAAGRAKPDDLVFCGRDGGPLGHRNLTRRGFEAARDRAGLDESLSFHDMRHCFASRAISRGVQLQLLSEVLGHSDSSITSKVYAHVFSRVDAEAAFRKAMSS